MNPGIACAMGVVFGLFVGGLAGFVVCALFINGRQLDEQATTRAERAPVRPWRAPHSGGYQPTDSVPEPTSPPPGTAGTAGTSRRPR